MPTSKLFYLFRKTVKNAKWWSKSNLPLSHSQTAKLFPLKRVLKNVCWVGSLVQKVPLRVIKADVVRHLVTTPGSVTAFALCTLQRSRDVQFNCFVLVQHIWWVCAEIRMNILTRSEISTFWWIIFFAFWANYSHFPKRLQLLLFYQATLLLQLLTQHINYKIINYIIIHY